MTLNPDLQKMMDRIKQVQAEAAAKAATTPTPTEAPSMKPGTLHKSHWSEVLRHIGSKVGYRPDGSTPFRVYLFGLQATGKTATPRLLWGRENVQKVELTDDDTPDTILGMMTLQDGSTVWQDGPAPIAYRTGATLTVNEFDMCSPSVKALVYGLLDDPGINSLRLPTGEVLQPKEGYTVVATSNESVDILPPALLSRFEVIINCSTPPKAALDTLKSPLLANYVADWYSGKAQEVTLPTLDFDLRRALAVKKLLPLVDNNLQDALYLALGNADQAAEVMSQMANRS